MALLPGGKRTIAVQSGDEKIVTKFSVNINVDGSFTTTLDADTVDFLISGGVSLKNNKRGTPGYYSADTLNKLIKLIHEDLELAASEEVIDHELVIKYKLDSAAAFAKTTENIIIPNAVFSDLGQPERFGEKNDVCRWYNGTTSRSATHPGPFWVKFYVGIFKKITYQNKQGVTRIVYERIHSHELNDFSGEDYTPLRYIANITTMRPNDSFSEFTYPNYAGLPEMIYTRERGDFFVDFFQKMCMLSSMITEFSKPEALNKLIEQQQKLLT